MPLYESGRDAPRPLLEETGQSRRLLISGLLFFGGLAITALRHIPSAAVSTTVTVALAIVGCSIALAGAVFALYGIRCPSCSLRWLSWSLRTQPFTRWLSWLQEFRSCPRCGVSSADAAARQVE
jgi:hypothetical protein